MNEEMTPADRSARGNSPASPRDDDSASTRGRIATVVGSPPSAPAGGSTPQPPQATPGSDVGGRTERSAPPAAPRVSRVRPPAPRRTRVVVRKVGPLSVLKFSLLFYLCIMLIVLFALAIVYGVLSAAGAVDSLERILGNLRTGTTSTAGAVPFEIDGRLVFAWGLVGGLISVVIWSVINVFVTLLYNLITDIVGGVEITLTDKPLR
jgi:hypothetical protein